MDRHKQVESSHYDFNKYMYKGRWNSIWYQLSELFRLKPDSILEVGPGAGILKSVSSIYGLNVETLDLDPDLRPDYVASATEMPFADNHYDVVCAFQMLEHLPYDVSLKAFAEMSRVARSAVVISLPDVEPRWYFTLGRSKLSRTGFSIPVPFRKPQPHTFDGEHYWEINKAGYGIDKVTRDFSAIRPLRNSYKIPENPYHRFFVFE